MNKINFKIYFLVSILILFFILSNHISFASEKIIDKEINEALTKMADEVGKDIDQFFKIIESSIILVIPKPDNIVYIVPGDEFNGEEEKLVSEKNKCTLDNMETRIKEIIDKGKSAYLFSVTLSIRSDIKYSYLFKVIERYEDAVVKNLCPSTTTKITSYNIWYRFGGYPEIAPEHK